MNHKFVRMFATLSKNIYKSRKKRREAIEQAQPFLAQSDKMFLIALIFIPALLPLSFDPTLLFNLPAWLWWMKTFAWMIALVRLLLYLLAALSLASSQFPGAAIDAMELVTGVDDVPVFFQTELFEVECVPLSKPPASAEQKAGRVSYWRQQWQRPGRRLFYGLLFRRQLPQPSLLEPAA
ncbi:MAG: hypothetical protein WAM60_03615 [Candidatus Promineifilaceae bacterium]